MSKTCKYPQLQDKDWLYQKYIIEKLSTVKISKLVGCLAGTVVLALYRRGIPTRSIKETAHKGHKSFLASLLNDPIWLKQKYWGEELTSYEIAKMSNSNQHSVMRALVYYKIKRRSLSKAASNRQYFWRKHHILENKNWLYQKYVLNKISSTDIAKEIGTTATNVIRALKKFNISRRSKAEVQHLIKKDSKYTLLNDKTFLEKAYKEDKLSTITIAKMVGARSCNSVRQNLIKNGIEVRNFREAQIHSRQDDGFIFNKAVIDGGLLGDATLGIYNKNSNISMPYYKRKNKFYNHILWVAKQLISNNPENYISLDKTILNGKTYHYPVLRTQSHEHILYFFKRWYPEDNAYDRKKHFIKIIPEDIVL